MTDATVLTVILNYKTAEMTLESLASARAAMDGIAGEIIVVDNDSQDGSFEQISAHVTKLGWDADNRVRVVQSGHNGGFGAGNNVGISAGLSRGGNPDFIYVLNSDAFPKKTAIRALLDHLQAHPDTGFAGSYIHGEDGARHTTTFRFPSIASEFESSVRFGPVSRLLKSRRVSIENVDATRPVDWLAGASMLMRKSVLDDIGLFDETFFLYFEETDLCRRARRVGHGIDFVRESDVMHIGSVSTGMKGWARVPGYWFDSRWHYFSKNHGVFYAAMATLAHLLGGSLHRLRCVLTGRKSSISPRFLTTLTTHDIKSIFFTSFRRKRHTLPASSLQRGE